MIYLIIVLVTSTPERGNVEIIGNIQSMKICRGIADSLRIEDRVREANCYKVGE
jgi:hypothetical protein